MLLLLHSHYVLSQSGRDVWKHDPYLVLLKGYSASHRLSISVVREHASFLLVNEISFIEVLHHRFVLFVFDSWKHVFMRQWLSRILTALLACFRYFDSMCGSLVFLFDQNVVDALLVIFKGAFRPLFFQNRLFGLQYRNVFNPFGDV